MEEPSSYYLQLQESRFKQQKNELEEVISRIGRGGGGGEELKVQLKEAQNEARQLRNKLKMTENELEKEKEVNRRLTEENEQLKQKPSTQKPLKRPTIDPNEITSGGQDAEMFKKLYLECVRKNVHKEIPLKSAKIIKDYLDKMDADEKVALEDIANQYDKTVESLKILEEDDNDIPNNRQMINALNILFEDIEKEMIKAIDKQQTILGNPVILEKFVLPELREKIKSLSAKESTITKKKSLKRPDRLDCRVCGYAGGRLLCEETPPHRVFCGESCQSKFYFINKSK